MKRCRCVDAEISAARLKNSGLQEAFAAKTFSTFRTEGRPPQVVAACSMARKYVQDFGTLMRAETNWFALLGQVGCGKTHLTIAVANELLAMNVGVVYMPYRDEITRIKQIMTDEVQYNLTMNRLKQAQVLVVDDLFKESLVTRNGERILNEADLRIMFELLNHRYFKKLPVIISSEYGMNRLLDMDEGLGSRIFEMSKGRFIEFKGPALNYRLTG